MKSMHEITDPLQNSGTDTLLIRAAAITVLSVHLFKWIWEQVFGTPLTVLLSKKFRKKQARELLDELLGENDSPSKRELIKIIDCGVYDHKSTPALPNYQTHCHAILAKHVKEEEVSVGISAAVFLQQK